MRAMLSIAEWARRCGRSHQRALRVCDRGYVPEAVPYIAGPKRDTWAIPEGTPWPEKQNLHGRPLPPIGYLHVSDWARGNNKNPRTVAFDCYLRMVPEAIKRDGYWFVPENMVWPVAPQGRPRKETRGA